MGKTLLRVLDSMTIVNPHLEGETRTGTLPLTSEVLLSDIALTNITEMLFNIITLFLLLLLSSLQAGHFHWIAGQ